MPDQHSTHIDQVTGPVHTGTGNIIQRVTQVFTGGPDVQRAQRNRQAMLKLVHDFWVKGVLEKSLYGAAMIELGLEQKAGAVESPWDMVLQTEREDRSLPPGTRIIDVFDEMGGSLLILGEPGSGKTTMLLELARDTIARAEEDSAQPIPVVLNLSSWAEKQLAVSEWLVEELNTKYNIPKRIAGSWIESNDLLLLLDGLDEVKVELQDDCIKAINTFRQEYGLTPVVICSRSGDYSALSTRLRLRGAIFLQPLTPNQIDRCLADGGDELQALRRMLKDDPILQELAQSPLMLNVMTLACQETTEPGLQRPDTVNARRKHLFETYVQRMFVRRGKQWPYLPEQTIHSLAWLARKMSHYAQSVYFIERMQPSWLPTCSQRLLYAVAVRVIIGMSVASVCALSYILTGGETRALAFGAITGLSVVLASSLAIKMPDGLAIGLVFGLTVLLASPLLGWKGGLAAGIVFGLQAGLAGVSVEKINVAEKSRWSWRKAIKVLLGVLGLSLVIGLVSRTELDVEKAITFTASVLAAMLPIGLAFMLALGWDHSKIVETTTIPNQGFWQSARNSIQVGLIAVLASIPCGVLAGILDNLAQGVPVNTSVGLPQWLTYSLLISLIVGLPVGLSVGGSACIQHIVLRLILSITGQVPWRLVHFLDYAAERILLRKVGGGYIFVHRSLSDYFAGLDV